MSSARTAVAGVDFGDAELAALVATRIRRIENMIHAEMRGDNDVLRDLAGALDRGGKRPIRPLITVLCAQLGNRADEWQVTAAGAATEMVHLATLHHDEVIDRLSDPSGDRSRQREQNNIAILAGDYLLAAASRLLSRLGPPAVAMIADSFANTTTGQIRLSRGASTDQCLRAVSKRTGSLITAAARFGATFGGASPDDVGRYTRLGRIIGSALQISDDVADIIERDVQRDPDSSNPAAMDALKCLHTLPVLYALAEPGPRAQRLQHLLSGEQNDFAEALSLLRESPGMPRAAEVARRYAEHATVELRRLPDGPGRQALTAVADYIRKRHP